MTLCRMICVCAASWLFAATPQLDAQLSNISTRGLVGTGAKVMVAGFVIDGPGTKSVLIRAAGPALAGYGLGSVLLANPKMQLMRNSTVLAENDDWGTASNASQVSATASRLGAFAFSNGSQDSALLTQLGAGTYTVVVSGVGGTTGIALVEVYDADTTASTTRLINISQRSDVGTGANALIAGFVVAGSTSRQFLVRATGPALAQFGVADLLTNPQISIFQNGSLVAQNDDWSATPNALAIADAANHVGAFALPSGSRDSTLLLTLPPGTYSAVVTGVNDTTGVGLVELYEVESPNISIALVGLGDTVRVTRSASPVFGGLAESPAGIARVSYTNATTNKSGTATGQGEWAATIPLAVGDNLLRFEATSQRGRSAEISTTVTYSPSADFFTPLTVSQDTLFIGQAKTVNFVLGVGPELRAGTVTLYRANADGTLVAGSGVVMRDNGVLPDEIQSDGLYTASNVLSALSPGPLYFRTQVALANGTTVQSELATVYVINPITTAESDRIIAAGQAAQAELDKAGTCVAELNDAGARAANVLRARADIAAAGSEPGGTVWYATADGLLGFVHPFLPNQRSATRENGAGFSVAAVSDEPSGPPFRYYTTTERNWEREGTPTAVAPQGTPMRAAAVASGTVNRMQSKQAIIISPYINNPNTTSNFGSTDDYFAAWEAIQSTGGNKINATTAVINNGSVDVTLDTFRAIGSYGYVHISSHGDNVYDGLLSVWNESWGPSDWLRASLSQVVVFTGIVVPKDSQGKWVLSPDLQAELRRHRVCIQPAGHIGLLPEFFKTYVTNMPNSLVAVSSCRSAINRSLSNALLARGAGAVIGFTDYVSSTYAQGTTKTIISSMIAGKTVGEGYSAATAQFGQNDGDNTPAALTLAGSDDLQLASTDLQNGSFEQGALGAWTKAGDGRIITQLGATTPTDGAYMAIISTGLGYTTTSGSVQQDFTVPSGTAAKLQFDWNFFSEEWLEYVGSYYQDEFLVTIVELDNSGHEIESTRQTVLRETIDSLASQVVPADVSFDQGGVYRTGWMTTSFSLAAYAGKPVRLKFAATDVGDSIYDSAILLDNVRVTSP